ncbi:uncharacterized protein VTP21DRAFT_4225 [Calcarisporiella thermophila]|uniref:uncharacterized protein n=1 Tax=Calcarisporiella thermophila TaxID=911321 RepID=UPI003744504D
MARPRRRRTIKNPNSKVTRKTANKHFKKVDIKSNDIIRKNWDKTQTLRQNYERLGLMSRLNGLSGGREINEPPKAEELTEEDIKKLAKTLGPEHGIIQRDEEGNIVNVIIGEAQDPDAIFDAEPEKVEAKTDVVRALEERASNAVKTERHQSEGEQKWVQSLIDKYGDDYEAMFRDIKMNKYQQTASQLRKRCEKYLASLN